MQKHFLNKNSSLWLIGASTGIGENLAYKLANQLSNLYISARNKEMLENVKKNIKSENVHVIPCDVSDSNSLRNAFNLISDDKQLRTVVFNAGIYNPTDILNFNLDDYLSHIDINYAGALRTMDVILPEFIERREGHFIVVSSVAGYRALPNAAAYGASKAALNYFMESARMTLTSKNIKISIINPGFVKTRLTDKNSFNMPFIITPEQASLEILKGIKAGKAEIHFPKRFTYIMKFFGLLPEPWYRYLMMRFFS